MRLTELKKVNKIANEMGYRLLVQYKSSDPFNGELHELGIFKNYNEAVAMGISLIDNTVDAMLVNRGVQYVLLRKK